MKGNPVPYGNPDTAQLAIANPDSMIPLIPVRRHAEIGTQAEHHLLEPVNIITDGKISTPQMHYRIDNHLASTVKGNITSTLHVDNGDLFFLKKVIRNNKMLPPTSTTKGEYGWMLGQ
jgi:hypothetical protein